MPPRILIVNHASVLGGAEIGLAEWVAFIDRNRVEPIVAVPDDGPLPDALRAIGVQVEILPLKRFRRTANPLGLIAMGLRLLCLSRALSRLAADRGVALLHANSTAAHLYTARAARQTRLPCIWHLRDLVELDGLGKRLYRRANAVVAISGAVAHQAQRWRQGRDRLKIIPNGIDTGRFTPVADSHACRQRLFPEMPPEARLIGMAGNLIPWKRHDLFLDMAEKLATDTSAQLRFVLIGDDRFGDHADYEKKLRRRIANGPLAGRARMTGFQTDMPAAMRALDVLVHPADREPFGRVLVEAMACAKPVVAVNKAGPAEIVVEGETGYLTPPDDAAAMAAAVGELIKDSDMRLKMGLAGRQRAVNDFDVRRVAADLTALYESLALCKIS